MRKLKIFLDDLVEIEYSPCVVGCPETHKKAQAFRKIRHKYLNLLPRNYLKEAKKDAKKLLIDKMKTLKYEASRDWFNKKLGYTKRRARLFHLDNDFFVDIKEFLDNPKSNMGLLSQQKNSSKEYNIYIKWSRTICEINPTQPKDTIVIVSMKFRCKKALASHIKRATTTRPGSL